MTAPTNPSENINDSEGPTQWYSVPEAARRLGISEGSVRYRIRRGTLTAERRGQERAWRIALPEAAEAKPEDAHVGSQAIEEISNETKLRDSIPPPGPVMASLIAGVILLVFSSLAVRLIGWVLQTNLSYRFLLFTGLWGAVLGVLIVGSHLLILRRWGLSKKSQFMMSVSTFLVLVFGGQPVFFALRMVGPERVSPKDGIAAISSIIVFQIGLRLTIEIVRRTWKY